jgi:hypothetical protein
MAKFVLFFILMASVHAQAGYFEIGGSGSYRKSSLDADHYTTFRSGTGSIAYYFWELSALELSYTKSRQDESTKDYEARYYTTFYGADLIFTLATKQSLFQPYIKVGGAYMDKTGSYKLIASNVTIIPEVKGWAPSAGLGFKIIVGEHIAIKVGIDAWSSPVSQDVVTYDYAGRVGLSFIF